MLSIPLSLRLLSLLPLTSQADISGGLNPTNYQKNGACKKILVQILSNQSQHKQINQFSPVLALGIKLGCGTNDLNQYVSHLIVYWVSSGHEEHEEQLYNFCQQHDHSLLGNSDDDDQVNVVTRLDLALLPY